MPGRLLNANETVQLQVTGRAGIPANAEAAAVTLTVVQPQSNGYLIAWPCGPSMANASVVNFEAGITIANMAIVKPGARGKVCIRTSAVTHVLTDVSGHFPAASPYTPNNVPVRILDSRTTGTPLAAGQSHQLDVLGVGGVPDTAAAVAVNFTVVSPLGGGYLTVYPCGQSVPTASTINFRAGQTIANGSIVAPGVGGNICILPSASTHVLVDVAGSFASGGFSPTSPTRLVDTRVGLGGSRRTAGSTLRVRVPPEAAVALNLTAVNPAGTGWFTVYPCGTTRPTASNANYVAGRNTANFTLANPGSTDEVCIYSSEAVDLLVDLGGSIAATTTYTPAAPTRLLDTRTGLGMQLYSFLRAGPSGQYARWNGCSQITITYRLVNHLKRSLTELNIIRAAFVDLSAATGFNFVETGTVITSNPGNNPFAEDYGVLVLAGYDDDIWQGSQIGVGGFYSTPWYEIVEGFLWIKPGLTAAQSRDVALHELGHMAGLGHIDDATQLMYPYLRTPPFGQFQAGDRDGLAMVGTAMPCVGAMRSATYDRDDLIRVVAED